MDKDLISTKEAADILGVSRKTVENWRNRKLFGCTFFSADEKHGDTWYYERERVEQLKEVYQKGILQNMYKLSRKFSEANPNLSDNFQKPSSRRRTVNSDEIFYDEVEVADILGVDDETVRRWRKSGKLKEVMTDHNGLHWYLADDVHKFKSTCKADKSSDNFQKRGTTEGHFENADKIFSKDRLSYKIPSSIGSDLQILEEQLLGMLLLKAGQVIPDIQAILTPDDFYFSDHKVIYKIILDLFNRNTPPNIISIIEELKATNQFSNRILECVLNIGESAFSNVYAEGHAKKIKEYSTRRQLIELSLHLNRKASKPDAPLDDVIKLVDDSIHNISTKSTDKKPKSKADFTLHRFDSKLSDALKYSNRKSGFSNIDDLQIFSPGLYVIGATPACGKTTFCWQLLEQFAANGETCFFCSYEMSEFELFSKSYAREMFKRDSSTKITAADIRNGAHSPLFYDVFTDAANETNSLQLFEFRDESVDDLLRIIRPHCNNKDKSPIVCIDYLQIIPPSDDLKLSSDKARIDDIVHKLKSFQRETNTTFIVISSFNRVNYYQQVSFESFKESGNIEYSADVVWALQLFVANSIKDGANISSTRKKFDDAKKIQPRQLHLKCLKNRQGNNYDCFFHYFSAHDFFQPATLTDFETNRPPEESKGAAQKNNADNKDRNRKTRNSDKPSDPDFGVPVSDDETRRLEDFWNSFN